MDFSEATDKFLTHLRLFKGASPHTLRGYSIDFRSFAAFIEAKICLSDISKRLVRRYLAGEACNKLATEYGSVTQTVVNTLRRLGHDLRESPVGVRSLTMAQRLEVAEACRRGETRPSVAKRYGIGTALVGIILRENEVHMKLGRPTSCDLDHTAYNAEL